MHLAETKVLSVCPIIPENVIFLRNRVFQFSLTYVEFITVGVDRAIYQGEKFPHLM